MSVGLGSSLKGRSCFHSEGLIRLSLAFQGWRSPTAYPLLQGRKEQAPLRSCLQGVMNPREAEEGQGREHLRTWQRGQELEQNSRRTPQQCRERAQEPPAPRASTHLELPRGRSASGCSWRRWRSRCPSGGRTSRRCSRQGHRDKRWDTGKAQVRALGHGPAGAAPRKYWE